MDYQCGDPSPQPISIWVSNTHFMLPLAIESWCLTNCDGRWHLDAIKARALISFALDEDATMFRLSPFQRHIRNNAYLCA